ncbi:MULTISPECIES: cell wall hydrolase [Carboxydocella]|uniref:N-acetylmuramoyl-L-alanine amidase n=2 Tax=Carboxydocella TaxID=178898 RepID=A0A1T4QS49_9FIRM|nr:MULTISPECIES: cell wall hydrolase [Carboxydocella]AVX20825.1 N-acetylmuramoyl-L-alanine amidase [Carboxydocella thermautotrophica]AVX31244.1 N-acetylmuramoyl-L-alanine amidase [Carboxydocella thermautotrophica]SKA06550.1 N-acetylmuramoyl-L-alanine amidase [Carboxydocella sporoproducens DSM 16521]GAW30005.1 cell wall hydrolase [Carboxydocella sp. ULO1]GAW32078.1 cell wall hydrolase [Carboxydocella sp. JDF658]
MSKGKKYRLCCLVLIGLLMLAPLARAAEVDFRQGRLVPIVSRSIVLSRNVPAIHRVRPGEYLLRIARQYNVSVQDLIRANGLKSKIIYPGQKLIIPRGSKMMARASGRMAAGVYYYKGRIIRISESEMDLLARLVHAEARGESFQGKVAVAAVVLNRVINDQFPDTVKEVILQKTRGTYQFSPVQDGAINLPADRESYEAVREALAGYDPTEGSLYFYNPQIATDTWIKTLPTSTMIGNHVFAR